MSDFGLLNSLFRRKKQTFIVNEPDPSYSVIYLGNVLTAMAKGDGCYDKPMSLIWKTYCSRTRPDLPMVLSVANSGLKAQTKQQGLTEYWSHRITFCTAPTNYPRVFIWIYKHEGKRLKPELRCHAVLCRKLEQPSLVCQALQTRIVAALKDYRREKLNRQNLRLSSAVAGHPKLPRRKAMLTGNNGNNFRPPMNRSKSAPKLHSIEEAADEAEEETISARADEHVDLDVIGEECDFSDDESSCVALPSHIMVALLEADEDTASGDGSIASVSSAESTSSSGDSITKVHYASSKLPYRTGKLQSCCASDEGDFDLDDYDSLSSESLPEKSPFRRTGSYRTEASFQRRRSSSSAKRFSCDTTAATLGRLNTTAETKRSISLDSDAVSDESGYHEERYSGTDSVSSPDSDQNSSPQFFAKCKKNDIDQNDEAFDALV